jgi:unsaturated rhamnogalacturonyl hydrolase
MNRCKWLCVACGVAVVFGFALQTLGQDGAARPADPARPDPMVEQVKKAALAMQRQSWEQGILSTAFLECGDDDMVVKIVKASRIFRSREGLVAAHGGAPVDPLMAGEAVWRASQISKDPDVKKAAQDMLEYALKRAPRAADGTIYHTGQQIWSDSFHTSPPFLAYAGHVDEAIKQIEGHRKRLWDPKKKLLSHIWDENRKQLQRKDFWGGGNGWTAAALTRIIRGLPEDKKAEKDRLAGYLKDLLDGCLAHQRPDGLFHDVIDNPKSFVETNLAQMLAYSIYESVRGGWLSADYLKAADRMRAAARAKVDEDGFVQGACAAPNFDRPGISPEAQAFFILMETAAAKQGQAKKPAK